MSSASLYSENYAHFFKTLQITSVLNRLQFWIIYSYCPVYSHSTMVRYWPEKERQQTGAHFGNGTPHQQRTDWNRVQLLLGQHRSINSVLRLGFWLNASFRSLRGLTAHKHCFITEPLSVGSLIYLADKSQITFVSSYFRRISKI